MYFKNLATSLYRGITKKNSVFLFLSCFVYVLMWPTLSSGLDSHHDGLVITTIIQTKSALFDGGEAPFNQYGPFWSVTYTLLSLPFSSESTLIVSRFITLTIYILTAICLYKTTQRLNSFGLWPIVIVLLLLTQPWTTGFGTTFLAWPSALSSFLLSLITYQIVIAMEKVQSERESAIIGLLICFLIFTRLQIGIAALFLTIVFHLLNRRHKDHLVFWISFMVSLSGTIGLLVSKGWFQGYLFDSIEFSLTYVQDKYSVNPVPLFTISFALIVLTLIVVFDRRSIDLQPKVHKAIPSYIYVVLGVSTFLIAVATLVFPNFQNFIILAVRRFWIGGLLGVGFFGMIKIFVKSKQKSDRHTTQMQIWLLLYGAVGMVQLYPLFDQVHFWWGLAPLIIPIAALILEQIKGLGIDSRKFLFACLLSIGIVSVVVPSIQRISSDREIYPGGLVKSVWISPESNSVQTRLQAFFSTSINNGSHVLNLCHNSDIFFDTNFARSSSRYFIYWPTFIGVAKIDADLRGSNPDAIVTCSQTQVPLATQVTIESQLRIIGELGFDANVNEKILLNGIDWKVYKK